MSVLAGVHNVSDIEPLSIMPPVSEIVHPNYIHDEETKGLKWFNLYDITVIKFSSPLPQSQPSPSIQPIYLPSGKKQFPYKEISHIAGLGSCKFWQACLRLGFMLYELCNYFSLPI